MRKNTWRQIITTVNFANDTSAAHEWTQDEVRETGWVIDAYADQHEAAARRTEYVLEFGYPQVFEYHEAGLHVVALLNDGQLASVFVIEDADTARYHTAARTGRTMKIRYTKITGQVSIREIEVASVRLTKQGTTVVRAHDRKADDTRSFRADRISHATLHRATSPARPTKAALAAAFRVRPVKVTLPAPRRAVEESAEWDLYNTSPDSAQALEAPESVQDKLAEAFAVGHRYVKVYV